MIIDIESEGCPSEWRQGCIHDTLTRIHWAARADINQFQTSEPLQLGVSLPQGADQDWPSMPTSLPESLVAFHFENSKAYVQEALTRAGCTEDMWTDIMYTACAKKILENKMEITYPSATGCTERCTKAEQKAMRGSMVHRAYAAMGAASARGAAGAERAASTASKGERRKEGAKHAEAERKNEKHETERQ